MPAGESHTVEPLNLGSRLAPDGRFRAIEGGGVASAAGFRAAGVHAGFRRDPSRLDLGLVVSEGPAACAGVFTRNVFCAAPVIVDREHLDGCGYGTARALLVNSGTANAATGPQGLRDAHRMAALVAEGLGCPECEVMVASTGVIGVHLPMDRFDDGVPRAIAALSAQGGPDVARAIMTTDTHPKEAAVSFEGDALGYPGCVFTVGGMAKGSGMIMPNMATMIACITTDAPVAAPDLHRALRAVADRTFNKVTVDSDTSTNDTCLLFANGAAAPGAQPFASGTPAMEAFEQALLQVCTALARAMAADGEGATKLVTVRVAGAASEADADAAARTIANSPLVKTAIFGHDANWGRIAAAAGRSGATFEQQGVSIDIMGIPVCRGGLPVPFSEEEALRRFERPEIELEVHLGAGNHATAVFTCDLTHDYITINGDYRT